MATFWDHHVGANH